MQFCNSFSSVDTHHSSSTVLQASLSFYFGPSNDLGPELLSKALQVQHATVTQACGRCQMLSLLKEAKCPFPPRTAVRVELANSCFRHHLWVAASQSSASTCTSGIPLKGGTILCFDYFPGNLLSSHEEHAVSVASEKDTSPMSQVFYLSVKFMRKQV